MKWTMVLLALAATTGGTARIKNKGKDAVVKQEAAKEAELLEHKLGPEVEEQDEEGKEQEEKVQVHNQYYGHGAFMGAANEMWSTPTWNAILKALMPDVHSDVAAVMANGGGMSVVMPMFENNPILAAFGALTMQRSNSDNRLRGFEWDVFLDPELVQSWLTNTQKQQKQSLQRKSAARAKVTITKMLETLLIAHGGAKETVKEAVMGWHQYNNVRLLSKTQFGGLLARDWMDIFGRAITSAQDVSTVKQGEDDPRIESIDESTRNTFANRHSFKDAVDIFSRYTGRKFAVILDVKHYSPPGEKNFMPSLLQALTEEMNKHGIRVDAIGVFDFHKFPSTPKEQSVMGENYGAPTNIKFFHHAGGLQTALHSSPPSVVAGDSVMFNAAYLVKYDADAQTEDLLSFRLDELAVGSLAAYQRLFKLRIGLYVQEQDLSNSAYEVIANAVNMHADIFEIGFAWGGVNGNVNADIKPYVKSLTRQWYVPLGAGPQGSIVIGGKEWDQEASRGTLMLVWLKALADVQREQLKASIAKQVDEYCKLLEAPSDPGYNDLGYEYNKDYQAVGDLPIANLGTLDDETLAQMVQQNSFCGRRTGACVAAAAKPNGVIEFSLSLGDARRGSMCSARGDLEQIAFETIPRDRLQTGTIVN